jgi:hypothetical protein
MLFIIENQHEFHTSAHAHGLNTRNRNCLHLPALRLTCAQKGVLYSGIKIFNSLPNDILNNRENKKRFEKELKKYLTMHSFYSVAEFLE